MGINIFLSLVLSGALTTCEMRRIEAIGIMTESGPMAVSYIPRCEFDGSFTSVQCWGSDIQCWCVDKNGTFISGTKTRGTPKCKTGTHFYFW